MPPTHFVMTHSLKNNSFNQGTEMNRIEHWNRESKKLKIEQIVDDKIVFIFSKMFTFKFHRNFHFLSCKIVNYRDTEISHLKKIQFYNFIKSGNYK